MSESTTRNRVWLPQLSRSLILLIAGLFITFSPNHDSLLGLLSLGAIALAVGFVIAWEAIAAGGGPGRDLGLAEAVAALVSGVLALIFSGTGAGTLLLITAIFAGSTGILELLRGILSRGKHPASRDWLTVGAMAAILAVIMVLLPADLARSWEVVDHGESVSGILTSQIIAVGLIGAWAILSGVFLFIAALSNKWAGEGKGSDQVEKKGASIAQANS
ncbi:MAG: DUF308 domain-containing protein [Homoserinimonas sp.]|nr:DUF308 domain-containing protein [Homoserinimonas sp.]